MPHGPSRDDNPRRQNAQFLPAGTRILDESFCIVRRVGQGGMSEVYLAIDRDNDRFALKTMKPNLAIDGNIDEFFRREAALESLRSPHIVAYRMKVEPAFDGRRFLAIVMEYIDGETLRQIMKRMGPVPEAALLQIARGAAEGLKVAHRDRVYHRDISPGNIMLRDNDPTRAVIIDFGIARNEDADLSTLGGSFGGTPRYAAKERFQGVANASTDMYALGMTLLAAARGTASSLDDRDGAGRPDLAGLGPRFLDVVSRLTIDDPSARMSSAQDLLNLLDSDEHRSLPPPPDAQLPPAPTPIVIDHDALDWPPKREETDTDDQTAIEDRVRNNSTRPPAMWWGVGGLALAAALGISLWVALSADKEPPIGPDVVVTEDERDSRDPPERQTESTGALSPPPTRDYPTKAMAALCGPRDGRLAHDPNADESTIAGKAGCIAATLLSPYLEVNDIDLYTYDPDSPGWRGGRPVRDTFMELEQRGFGLHLDAQDFGDGYLHVFFVFSPGVAFNIVPYSSRIGLSFTDREDMTDFELSGRHDGSSFASDYLRFRSDFDGKVTYMSSDLSLVSEDSKETIFDNPWADDSPLGGVISHNEHLRRLRIYEGEAGDGDGWASHVTGALESVFGGGNSAVWDGAVFAIHTKSPLFDDAPLDKRFLEAHLAELAAALGNHPDAQYTWAAFDVESPAAD